MHCWCNIKAIIKNRPLRQQEPAFAWITLAFDVSRQLAIIFLGSLIIPVLERPGKGRIFVSKIIKCTNELVLC